MRKVSLREIVADKIVFAILIALYYWMWARNDWHNYYTSIQYAVFAFTFFYFISRASRLRKYKQERPDEMSEANLKRCDALCLKIGAAGNHCSEFRLCCRQIVNNNRPHWLLPDGYPDCSCHYTHDSLLHHGHQRSIAWHF